MRRLPTFLLACVVLLASSAAAQTYKDPMKFWADFRKAVQKDDFAVLQQTVKNAPRALVFQAFRNGENSWCLLSLSEEKKNQEAAENTANVLEQLALVNRIVHKDAMLVKRWRWVGSLSDEQKQAKTEINQNTRAGSALWGKAQKARTEGAVNEALPHYLKAAAAAEKATDYYELANCYYLIALLHEWVQQWFDASYYYSKGEQLARNAGHAARPINDFQLGARLRTAAEKGKLKPELIDTTVALEEARAKYKQRLEELIRGPVAKDGANGGAAGGAVAGGADSATGKGGTGAGWNMPPPPTSHEGGMEWVEDKNFKVRKNKKPGAFWNCWIWGNGDWHGWTWVSVARDESVSFKSLPGSYQIKNDGGKLFLVHPKAKGKKRAREDRLKVRAKPTVTTFKKVKYRDGSTGNVYLEMMLRPGSFNEMGFNLRGSGGPTQIRLRGASMAVGKVRGIDVAILDSSANGRFNDWGQDTVIVGKGKTAVRMPLSKYMVLGGLMYQLKVDENGQRVRSKPYDGDMAPLKVDLKINTRPQYLVARGTASDVNYYVNLMDAVDKPIWVLPGSMQISHGYIAVGDKNKALTVTIAKGRNRSFKIEVGKGNVWKLGGSGEKGFHFSFKARTTKKKGQEFVQIEGKSIAVYGEFGEEYKQFNPGHVLPLVSIRKGKDGTIWLPKKKMRKPEREDYNKEWIRIYYPKTLKTKKLVSGEYSVMLEADYAILGHIKSEWLTGE